MLTKLVRWAARTLGILLLIALAGLIVYSIFRIQPESEENIGSIILMGVSAVLICFLTVILLVAWRRETVGGILYLTFSAVLYLAILAGDLFFDHPANYGSLYLYAAPVAAAGLLFVISGFRMKTGEGSIRSSSDG